MPRMPVVSGDEAIRAFRRAGWSQVSQAGDHVTLDKAGARFLITIPRHKELSRGVLRDAIRKAGLTVDEFRKLLG
jgi:predicted RNA binding protein YcfA (HicA-like mRNA interferase family)